MSDSNGLLASFLGGLQASLSVLLVISYGVAAAQLGILKDSSAKDISKLCVRLFLPALLISNVGSQLHADTGVRYVPVLIWSIIYTTSSLAIGFAARHLFKMPAWGIPALAFNNTTSLPLLLIESLEATGVLKILLMSDDDGTSDAVARAKSYFLVCAIVCNTMTFALGPKLLDGEHAPDEDDGKGKSNDNRDVERQTGDIGRTRTNTAQNSNGNGAGEEPTEHTSLLPDAIASREEQIEREGYEEGTKIWAKLPNWLKPILEVAWSFFNSSLIGALIGAIIGLTPPLHKAFFNETEDGGIFTAWLTSSIKNIGELFAALQLVVVGSKLKDSLVRMKKGEDSGQVPWKPLMFIFFVRFILWPVISILVIWGLVKKTNLLSNDPILWFALMMMPTGPPAIKLTALADVNGSPEEERLSIAKFLTISYCVSPVICFAVVGALKACESVR